jgi:Bacterial Ig-like domain
MRWGEPTRLPPLRRGRGLTAAALLTVGLVAAYVILGVLSLTSVAPSTLLERLPKTVAGVLSPEPVPAHAAHVGDFLSVRHLSGAPLSAGINFPRVLPGAAQMARVENTSSIPLRLNLNVVGSSGVYAAFANGSTRARLPAGRSADIAVTPDPTHAGPLDSTLVISMAGAAPLSIQLTGDQAPLPPGTVTATPEAGGAVHVTWPASPSTGVAGYAVERRAAGGTWQPLAASAGAGGIVDQTGTDSQTFDYRVRAIAAHVQPALYSAPGAPGTAVTDAVAPDAPVSITPPDFVNQQNENAVPVEVVLPPTSTPTDVVSVTLTGATGGTASATTAGGQPSVVVHVDASQLAEGSIGTKVTLTDAAGNATVAEVQGPTTKDTVAPAPPTDAQPPEVVNGDSASSVPVVVHIADPESNERVHVQITGGDQTADGSADVSGAATTVAVDVSKLPDGQLSVSAWAVDAAGNTSDPTDGGTFTKDTSAPVFDASIHVAAGDRNPAGYVNAASAGAVTVVVRFGQPTDPADEIGIAVGGQRIHRDGGEDSYIIGPLDLTDRPDGPLPLAVTVTDSAGNSSTTTDSATKDTVAPVAPSSFTVPESSHNAAGFVNSFTQSAAIIQATFPDGTDSSDSLTASVDGIDLGTRVGGSIAVAWRADVSGLPDGQLDLHGTITDAAGNTTDFSGRAVKETRPPPPPVAAHVIGFCRPDTITPATASDVAVQVVLPDAPGLSGTVTVTLTDSAGHTASGSAWGGPGIVVVHGIDAGSFVPGNVRVAVSVTDSAGNTSTFAGTTAVLIDG